MTTFLLALALLQAPANYTCEGVNEDGKYAVKLEVHQHGDNYFLVWTDETGSYEGFGIKEGDKFAAVFVVQGGVGMVLYEDKGGVLDGVWAVGDGKKYTEVCKPADARAA